MADTMLLERIEDPSGRYEIVVRALRCGGDWNISLCGGTAHHVGAVSMAVYEPERDSATVSTLTRYTHRDDHLSMRFAKYFARALQCTVVVAAGVHVDGATARDLQRLQENAALCCGNLLVDMMARGKEMCDETGDPGR